MTTEQLCIVGAIGGLSALIGLIVFVGVAVGIYAACMRLAAARDAWRERRRVLAECRAIDALGTTTHPTNQ